MDTQVNQVQALLDRLGWPAQARGEKGVFTRTSSDGAMTASLVVDPQKITARIDTVVPLLTAAEPLGGGRYRILEASWDHAGTGLDLWLHGSPSPPASAEKAFIDATATLRQAPGTRSNYVCMGRLRAPKPAPRPPSGLHR